LEHQWEKLLVLPRLRPLLVPNFVPKLVPKILSFSLEMQWAQPRRIRTRKFLTDYLQQTDLHEQK
jgi:hypothetical protein